jgi:hypothetical protein
MGIICPDHDNYDRNVTSTGVGNDTVDEHITSRLMRVHTCTPGVIVSFDSTAQTVVAKPLIQSVWITPPDQLPDPNKPPVALTLPQCLDVPVFFPAGGGWWLTFPIAAGDECILCFSERCIDGWWQTGPGQELPPPRYRMHHQADAFALVGVNSNPKVLTNFFTTGVEIRTRDDSTYVRVSPGHVDILADVHILGNLHVDDDVQIDGDLNTTGDTEANDISLEHHVHGDSGPPTGDE